VNKRKPHVFEKADRYCSRRGRVSHGANDLDLELWKWQPTLYAILVRGLDLCQRVFSVGKGRKTVNLKTTMKLDQKRRMRRCHPPVLQTHPCTRENRPRPNFALPYLRHVEYADAEANIVEGEIRVFLVRLVDEGLFWGEAELRGVYRDLVLLCEKKLRVRYV
jgi:hypothetical protein